MSNLNVNFLEYHDRIVTKLDRFFCNLPKAYAKDCSNSQIRQRYGSRNINEKFRTIIKSFHHTHINRKLKSYILTNKLHVHIWVGKSVINNKNI